MTILVIGKSGAGKSFFCRRLIDLIDAGYFNNDSVRSQTQNADFSMAGRLLAAKNMRQLIDQSSARIKIVDMICPTKEMRAIISPDVIVFIDHPGSGKYPDTDAIFERPTNDEAAIVLVYQRSW